MAEDGKEKRENKHISDVQTSIQMLRDAVDQMIAERDWHQFHSPKNLSMYIVGEAAELMEPFSWVDNQESFGVLEEKREAIEHELADVLIVCMAFANACKIDVAQAFMKKLEITKSKYPIEKSKGSYKKYTELK